MRVPRGEAGRMLELQIVFAVLILAVLAGVAKGSAFQGVVYAVVWLVGIFGGLILLSFAISWVAELVQKLRERRKT